MTLHMYSFQPDIPRLMRLAARERLLPPGDDPGYAIHAVLAATFGVLAPKPWALFPPGQGGGPSGRLLGYGTTAVATLLDHAATYADPAFSGALALDRAAAREMPTRFDVGTLLGFRVRLRPVARTGKPLPGHPSAADRGRHRARERDVYLARVDMVARKSVGSGAGEVAATGTPVVGMPPGCGAVPSRAEVYLDWLADRLAGAGAALVRAQAGAAGSAGAWDARVEAFRLTRLMSRDRSGGRSRTIAAEGPDVTVSGMLAVTDTDAFAAGLTRGVGRYRAFGFGMLLLSPPQR